MSKVKRICEQCGSQNLKARLAVYPIKMENKEINVNRVSVRECLDCHTLMPTEKGKEKIERCMMSVMHLLYSERNFNTV